jgi:hypothetical protein
MKSGYDRVQVEIPGSHRRLRVSKWCTVAKSRIAAV